MRAARREGASTATARATALSDGDVHMVCTWHVFMDSDFGIAIVGTQLCIWEAERVLLEA